MSVSGLQQEVALGPTSTDEFDPLLFREGTFRNGWQPTADALLTMERLRQLVATHGNGFRLFEPLSRAFYLLPVAPSCYRWAP